ncbi:MAG: heme ABC transporter ATP-binding protein [Gemmatimonadetes bacterium]|nr:heme ABC transporter ATP-binding protein [Gemmatimonadota bacterium]
MRFSARDVVAGYARAPEPVLDGVSLAVPPGTLYAVLGPNGSGKSTLLRVLLGALAPTAGVVELDGRPLPAWNRRELARSVGVVPQSESIAFPLSVRELVAMGRYPHLGFLRAEGDADRSAVAAALERCDVAALRDRDVTTLSGGELQRVRIARALAQEPRALALDEPTASLDVRHEMSILELLRASADQGLTVVLVTHHLNLAARFADRMLLLHEGRVAAEGTPREVFVEDVLERVYGWPVRVDEDPVAGAPRVVALPGSRPG